MIGRFGLFLFIGWILLSSDSVAAQHMQAQAGPPVAVPGGPYSGTVGQPVTFTGSDKTTLGILPAQYQWSFGDGATGFGQTVTHIYAQPGIYLVTLTVTHQTGLSNAQTTSANITGLGGINVVPVGVPPFLVSAGGPYGGPAGVPLSFSATATGVPATGPPLYSWNFGDGTTAFGQFVTHAYGIGGSYVVTVTAAAGGQVAVSQVNATITQPPAITAQPAVTPIPVATQPIVTPGTTPTASYAAGWNLVAGPQGTAFAQASGPLYTLQPGDAGYQTSLASAGVQAGYGYWAYFAQPATVALAGTSVESSSLLLPGGQFALVGNPSATATISIRGADYATTWDPQANSYVTVTTLLPGAGAWVYSALATTVTLSP